MMGMEPGRDDVDHRISDHEGPTDTIKAGAVEMNGKTFIYDGHNPEQWISAESAADLGEML